MSDPLFIAIVAFLTILALCTALHNLNAALSRRREIDEQLVQHGADPYEATLHRESVLRQLGSSFDRSRWAPKIEEMMADADLSLKPSEWVAGVIGVGLALFLFFTVVLKVSLTLGLVAAIVGMIFIPRSYLGSRRNHYLETFEGQLGEASLLMGNSLRAGLSISQAVEVVSREMPPPAGREFAALHQEIVLGASAEEAIEHMVERLPGNELKVMMTAIMVQSRAGGNLARVLSEMAYAMGKRRELHGEVKTMMAEPRFVAIAVPFLPVALLVLMRNSMPELVNPLFEHPIGWVILAVFTGMQVLAFVLTSRISRIRV